MALAHDGIMGAVAMLLAFVLRLDFDGFLLNWPVLLGAATLFGVMVSTAGFLLGLNRGIWRYASLPDLVAIAGATSVAIALFIVAEFLLIRLNAIPRSSVVIAWAFTVVLLAGPRAAYRVYRNHHDSKRRRKAEPAGGRNVLLIGATDNAEAFLRAIKERDRTSFEVLAIIDERGRRTGRSIRGVPVMGPLERLPQILSRFEARGRRPEAIILTRSRDDYERHASIEALVEIAATQKLEILRLPNLLDMQSIDAKIELRPIKLEDLLQRDPVRLDVPKIQSMIQGKTIMITGAGGSIGSELARQIADLEPGSLILLDASEFALYTIKSELSQRWQNIDIQAALCNVREKEAVRTIVERFKPDVLFHAAALKHVPMVEAQPLEGIFTNAIGTRNVADAALSANVSRMIMVSTDKAVNPANVMGATKRMAEMYCQALDLDPEVIGTRFITVRFGNVLGSAGSVVPLFEQQIKAGGPVTVTHADMERFFMTIPEACLLVLQAAAYTPAPQHERGRIFVLDMGSPVKIVDLARNLIRLSGRRPDKDIQIVYTGLRPGEKLYEELFDSKETLSETGASGILAASSRSIKRAVIVRIFDEMQCVVSARDLQGAVKLLKSTVPEFTPGMEDHLLMSIKRSAKS
ncbi:MAG: polysaccharide biosynthesis protein [Mesorhizobium sp.]|nr:polysaccharide biosynthesis protein [Mesorhizobium sp. M7A.F.Ca.MR.362.00.0.0]RUV21040.1 polysaccharide biosynthesis protein [Mesorhizobium sp. M7A.F.Ca.MR.245.00.0.0]RUV51202.1 polysaccharide biosynthesis protein [Mesorhizobium sp. M7A.F.Ca.MR.228.00.0.0]RWN96430.1 MAG: polysaccharide biosynthesis protein [Mesorhizobium sp.]